MKNSSFFLITIVLLLFGLGGCIGDDIIDDMVEPVVRIMNPIDTIEINTNYQFEATYFNNVGQEVNNTVSWSSSNENIISVTSAGLATANELGNAILTAEATSEAGVIIQEERMLIVGNSTVVASSDRTGSLQTTSSYALKGDFTLEEDNGILKLSFADNYEASTALPGLYVYLTNNPNTTSGAFEIGKVEEFSGAHTYELPSTVDVMDYEYVLYFCKPFNVKVGDGQFGN